jgi:hypothetical protein
MKILVQSRNTLHYYKGIGEWTSEAEEAHDFISSSAAERICKEHSLTNVRMVVKLDRPGANDILLNFLSKEATSFDHPKV